MVCPLSGLKCYIVPISAEGDRQRCAEHPELNHEESGVWASVRGGWGGGGGGIRSPRESSISSVRIHMENPPDRRSHVFRPFPGQTNVRAHGAHHFVTCTRLCRRIENGKGEHRDPLHIRSGGQRGVVSALPARKVKGTISPWVSAPTAGKVECPSLTREYRR